MMTSQYQHTLQFQTHDPKYPLGTLHSPDRGPAVAVQVGLVLRVEGTELFGELVTHVIVVGGHAGEAPLHKLVCIVHLYPTHHCSENMSGTLPT